MKITPKIIGPLLLLSLLSLVSSTGEGQGTAFTYQGQLQGNGSLASGTYNFQFTLYTNSSGGVAVAGPVTNNAIAVTNGLFTVAVDFGAVVWNGETNWLQIGVESNNVTSFIALSPRQQITPTPYAIFAESANAAGLSGTVPMSSLSGTYGGAVSLTNSSNSFTGNGSGLTNVNATVLGGLTSSNFWQLSGNTGTKAGTNFVGTTDNQPLELHVNGFRALRMEPTANVLNITNAVNVIGGSSVNTASGAMGATIGGGGASYYFGLFAPNRIGDNFCTIGGGVDNYIGTNCFESTVSGGNDNWILAGSTRSVISGGFNNIVQFNAPLSSIGGGYDNQIFGDFNLNGASLIAGGFQNVIFANSSTSVIGGGTDNQIYGDSHDYGDNLICGGYYNTINSNSWNGFIGGGQGNTIRTNSPYASIGGGLDNTNQSAYATIGGGAGNAAGGSGEGQTIGGGFGNIAGANVAFVGGGYVNTASGSSATVGGGSYNYASGNGAFIGGGGWDGVSTVGNTNQASAATIGGGLDNLILGNASYAFIGGGTGNIAGGSGQSQTIGGGFGNVAGANAAVVGGGYVNTAIGSSATVGGGSYNYATGDGAFIGGGGWDGSANDGNTNQASAATIGGGLGNLIPSAALYAFIGGGEKNVAGGYGDTVGGGTFNTNTGQGSFIGGGGYDGTITSGNFVNANAASICGGMGNSIPAGSRYAFIGGGASNTAAAFYAMVPGGAFNNANGTASFAAGAYATAGHDGDFVWSDDTGTGVSDSGANQFVARASGGFFFYTGTGSSGAKLASGATSWTTLCDRNAKKNFQPVDTVALLNKLAAVPIEQWNYKWEKDSDTPNIGPMAQDFIAAFYPGRDDKGITTLQFDGVELAAIQGLNEKLEAQAKEKDAEIADLKKQNEFLAQRMDKLEEAVKSLTQKN